MPKATAVWLVDNTTLTFDQIADFTKMHPLEISGIADGEIAIGIKGFDPISNNQLTRQEIERCEKNPEARLQLLKPTATPQPKKKAPRYTPLSKRQDRPAAIAWLVRNHPELADSQITKLLGTTKQTIEAIRSKTHWNSQNIQPVDPVALGLCAQMALDAAVKLAAEKRAKEAEAQGLSPEALAEAEAPRENLLSTDESLQPDPMFAAVEETSEEEARRSDLSKVFDDAAPGADAEPDEDEEPAVDADALFNLPKSD